MTKMIFFLLLIGVTVNTMAQEITVFGSQYYQDTIRISKKKVKQLMAVDGKTHQLWKKSKNLETGGLITGIAGLGLYIAWLADPDNFWGGDDQGLLYGTIGLEAVSLGLLISSGNLKKKAILKFNQGLEDEISINISPTINGIGLVVQFGK